MSLVVRRRSRCSACSLQHIFLARMWLSSFGPEDMTTLTYRKLIEISRHTVVEGELCLA